MGTSTSSAGPGAGASLDPPWLNQLLPAIATTAASAPAANVAHEPGTATPALAPPTFSTLVAPAGRFSAISSVPVIKARSRAALATTPERAWAARRQQLDECERPPGLAPA